VHWKLIGLQAITLQSPIDHARNDVAAMRASASDWIDHDNDKTARDAGDSNAGKSKKEFPQHGEFSAAMTRSILLTLAPHSGSVRAFNV
jgi:hypothetical protein